MVIIVSILAFVILAGLVTLIKLTPHKQAGPSQKPHPAQNGPLHPGETRSPGVD